jgi:hypothetical protein
MLFFLAFHFSLSLTPNYRNWSPNYSVLVLYGKSYFWSIIVWATVFLRKCLSNQMLSGQTSIWANVFWGKCLSGQMSFWANDLLGKCLLGKCLFGQMSFWANVFWANDVWANIFMGKCLSGKMSSGQMSFWANVVWANVSGQMSLGKCRMGKRHGTVSTVLSVDLYSSSSVRCCSNLVCILFFIIFYNACIL